MNFIHIKGFDDAVDPLRDRLMKELGDGKQVLWLVPGGSNIPLTVAVMAQLPDDLTHKLTILLTDERYGSVGHQDSNAHQLDETGFVPKHAFVVPVLYDDMPLEETCSRYGGAFHEAANRADFIIGQFGMGGDGHIAGILPGSPAVSSSDYAAGYATETFVRVTLTPKALHRLTTAYVFAFGTEKRKALMDLQSNDLDINQQPAQLLRQLPEANIYNDQID